MVAHLCIKHKIALVNIQNFIVVFDALKIFTPTPLIVPSDVNSPLIGLYHSNCTSKAVYERSR
jgi:hypothetical protein